MIAYLAQFCPHYWGREPFFFPPSFFFTILSFFFFFFFFVVSVSIAHFHPPSSSVGSVSVCCSSVPFPVFPLHLLHLLLSLSFFPSLCFSLLYILWIFSSSHACFSSLFTFPSLLFPLLFSLPSLSPSPFSCFPSSLPHLSPSPPTHSSHSTSLSPLVPATHFLQEGFMRNLELDFVIDFVFFWRCMTKPKRFLCQNVTVCIPVWRRGAKPRLGPGRGVYGDCTLGRGEQGQQWDRDVTGKGREVRLGNRADLGSRGPLSAWWFPLGPKSVTPLSVCILFWTNRINSLNDIVWLASFKNRGKRRLGSVVLFTLLIRIKSQVKMGNKMWCWRKKCV